MLPTWIPFVCVLSILLWMTGISSLRIDTYILDDWGNETNYIRMLMEKEIASWTPRFDIPIYLYFTSKSLIIDHNLFVENGRPDDVNSWKIVLDLTTTVDLMNCGAAMANDIPYITSSSEESSDCHPMTFRASPSNILQPVVDMFEIGGTSSEVKLLLLESGYELNPSIFDTRNNSESEIIVYSINELVLEERAARRLLLNARRVVILAPYLQILHFFNQMEQTVRMLKNEWILVPVDSETCPGHLDISYICIEGYNKANTMTLWMDALNFIKGAVATLEQVDDHTNITGMEYFHWYSTSDKRNQSTISISKHTSFNSSTVVGEFAAGQTTLYERPEDLFEPPPPPVLKVVVILEPPFVQRVIHDNGSVSYEGYSIDVLQELARRSGFKYEIYEVPDKEYGVLRSNGTWSGIIGQVASGAADMGAGPISVTAEREAVIDFTVPYYDYAGLQILTKDTREPPSLFVFVTVFTELAWGVWLILLIATVVILCVFHRLKYKYLTEEDTGHDSEEKFTIKNSFWFVTMSVAIAGPQHHPSMTSTRLVVAGFWFFCQIIMSAYTANLAAFLTSSRLASPVESLDDLVTQSAYQYTVQKGTVGETYFQRMAKIEAGFYSYWKDVSFSPNSKSALTQYAVWDYPLGDKYIKLWQSMQETGYVFNTEEGINKVLEGNFVLFHETPMIKFEMSRRCGLLSVGTMFSAKPYAFVLPQNSPNVKDISSAILSIQSTTILTKLKEKWWESNNITCPNNDDSEGLTLNALGGIFIVIGGGCLLSVVILGVELLIAKCGKPSVPFLAEDDKTEERDVGQISHQTHKSADISDDVLSKMRSYEVPGSVNTSSL